MLAFAAGTCLPPSRRAAARRAGVSRPGRCEPSPPPPLSEATAPAAARIALAGGAPPRMEMPRGVGGDGAGGSGDIPRGRLGEFAHAGGDRAAQDQIVDDLRWQVAQVTSEGILDENIRQFGSGMSDLLSGMFLRRERDIIKRNEALALRAALADIARWNYTYREGQEACRKKREQISEELAVVNKLLLSQQKAKKKGRKSRHGRRAQLLATASDPAAATTTTSAAATTSTTGGTAPFGRIPIDWFGSIPRPLVLPFIGLVSATCLFTFEQVVQETSPAALAQASFASLIAIVASTHLVALRDLTGTRR